MIGPPTETNDDAPRVVYRAHPTLRFTDAAGAHAVVVRDRLVLGSSEEAGLRVVHGTVSRVHAEIEPGETGLSVRDLGSRNGIWVGGLRITAAIVPDGTRIAFGATEVLVDYSEGHKHEVEVWPGSELGALFGQSLVMREVFALAARVAASDAPVLVHGETGTGKELVAQAIHDRSTRKDGPFVVVDCAALPEHLLEAELFGHTRGAFTGATHERIGAIEAAAGGTLFLDEIGELPLAMQPKLLRAVESRTVRRLGANDHRRVDVRFVCATHRDLAALVASSAFREDLYFRLAVLRVDLPPLRARRDDVLPLVRRMLASAGRDTAIPREAMPALERHGWPGNVRELRNVVDRAAALGWGEAIRILGRSDDAQVPRVPVAEAASEELLDLPLSLFRDRWAARGDQTYLDRLLAKHGGSVPAAAVEANVDPSYIYRILRRLGRNR